MLIIFEKNKIVLFTRFVEFLYVKYKIYLTFIFRIRYFSGYKSSTVDFFKWFLGIYRLSKIRCKTDIIMEQNTYNKIWCDFFFKIKILLDISN